MGGEEMAYRHPFGGLVLAGCAIAAGCMGTGSAPPAFDSRVEAGVASRSSYLYVADGANPYSAQVDVLLRRDLGKGILGKFAKRMEYPDGIFVDPSGTLYVANAADSGHDRVTVYGRDGRGPLRVYRGIKCAFDVVAGSDGSVYVADPCGVNNHGTVHIYAPNSTEQIRMLHPDCAPYSLVLDAQDNLYVACYMPPDSYWGQVKRFRHGSLEGVDLLPDKEVGFIGGITLDGHGALLVADGLHEAVDVFTAERKPPSQVIKTGQTFPYRLALDQRENRLYVSAPYLPDVRERFFVRPAPRSGPKRPNTVVELAYPSGRRLLTLRNVVTGWIPMGVAVFPPAPFGGPF